MPSNELMHLFSGQEQSGRQAIGIPVRQHVFSSCVPRSKSLPNEEDEIAEASADQPAAASTTEAASHTKPAVTEPAATDAAPHRASEAEVASQPVPAATEHAPALSEPAPKNEWPAGTRVMVRNLFANRPAPEAAYNRCLALTCACMRALRRKGADHQWERDTFIEVKEWVQAA